MKKIIFFFFILSVSTCAFSQNKDSSIGYTGGFNEFIRTILKRLHFDDNKPITSPELNRYYSFVFTITNSSKISVITVNSIGVMDSVEISQILNQIRKTENKWINNSGEDQTIVLPIYFVCGDCGNKEQQKPPNEYWKHFNGWTEKKLIYLEPITAETYTTGPDHISIKGTRN